MNATATSDILNQDDSKIGALFVGFLFVAITGGIYAFLAMNTNVFSQSVAGKIITQLLIGLLVIFIAAVVANYVALDFLQDHARAILVWSYNLMLIFFGLLIFGGAALLIYVGLVAFGGIMLVIGLIFAFFIIRSYRFMIMRLERAAQWLTIATTVVLNEPGMIIIAFVQSLVIGIGMITESIAVFVWRLYATNQNLDANFSQNVLSLIGFLYLWFMLFVLYYFDGANTFIAYVRIKGADPTVGQGFAAASHKMLSLIGYAFVTAVVTTIVNSIRSFARQQRSKNIDRNNIGWGIAMMLLSFLASIAQYLYYLVSFFTLPSIIIRKNSLADGMRESYNLFKKYAWDVIISDMGYSYGQNMMYIVSALVSGGLGFVYGYFTAQAGSYAGGPVLWGIIIGIAALIIGILITKFFLRPLYTSFVTTIYVYATEGPAAIAIAPNALLTQIDTSLQSDRSRSRIGR